MRLAAACLLALLSAGCLETTKEWSGRTSTRQPATGVVLTPAGEPAPSSALTSVPLSPLAPAVRAYPVVPREPEAIAVLLVQLETALRSAATAPQALPDLGHRQQVIYRRLAADPALSSQVRVLLPRPWLGVFDRHLAARREFLAMHLGAKRSTVVPAWRILPPEPAGQLLRYYKEASAATGIAWEVLAAVNLVETGMGRIDGISLADARGPMQFLPSTWAEPGIGQGGDIRNPRDAIPAAARYLVRRGGLKDIRKGLWGYNNSRHYVRAVLLYADLLKEDPAAFTGLYHWEIHFLSTAGDLWLPVGYDQPRPLPVALFLKRFPSSAPAAP
jgi:hypothetical protein